MLTIRNTITSIIILLMLVSVSKGTLMYLWRNVNPTMFTSLFCENKDRPEMECEGMCKLHQVVDQESEDSKKKSENVSVDIPLSIFNLQDNFELEWKFFSSDDLNEDIVVPYSNLYRFEFTDKLIHPPCI